MSNEIINGTLNFLIIIIDQFSYFNHDSMYKYTFVFIYMVAVCF